MRFQTRKNCRFEPLEDRALLNGDCAGWHNATMPEDVNTDAVVSPIDALSIVNYINHDGAANACDESGEGEAQLLLDVNNDGWVSPIDVLHVVNRLNAEGEDSEAARRDPAFNARLLASLNDAERLGKQNLLTTGDVDTLLRRASQATASTDAIIAVVDRGGRILGVRVESGVSTAITSSPDKLAFAIDGAVAKARTAAFFSSNAAPLPSRTVRFISQSTVTQREVESAPLHDDVRYRGPGFVAPIGVGGHFPPEIPFTPQVDLFAIEHQSRDRQLLEGLDGIFDTADDLSLVNRFNVHPLDVATCDDVKTDMKVADDCIGDYFKGADAFFDEWPESFGVQAGTSPFSQSRGIATLPGGVPLFKVVTDSLGNVQMQPGKVPALPDANLVGGIGVFFPGEDGYASHEQGFVHTSKNAGRTQSEGERTNAARVLESEYMALVASAGAGIEGTAPFRRSIADVNTVLDPLPNYVALNGRIDLVGITLEIFGPTPTRSHPVPGIDHLLATGRAMGTGVASGTNVKVTPDEFLLAGQAVPEEWLVVPHDSSDGLLTAEQVEAMILEGIREAELTRAAIRLDVDNNFRPGERTRMVFAVADTNGEVLGVYRMPDATIFSIDVAIAKARNTAYYADPAAIVDADRIDFNGDGGFGAVTTVLNTGGDTVPKGTSLTNRTFRFLVEPRYPTGAEPPEAPPGPQSILVMAGVNPLTAENTDDDMPLPFGVYASVTAPSTTSYDAFVPSRNFRDPGDAGVKIAGTTKVYPLANQNGVVFFPGSSSLYVGRRLVGGLGVSGDGVDQDDVVTIAAQAGFDTPTDLRVDQFVVGDVRLPFQKTNRNPRGA